MRLALRGAGRSATGKRLPSDTAERVIRLVAACVGVEAHRGAPIVSAELPGRGERFEGLLPPIVSAPTFAIRKKAIGIIALERYLDFMRGAGGYVVTIAEAEADLHRERSSLAERLRLEGPDF